MVVNLLQTVFGFVAALMVLVAVHEFGHFYVARRCGVRVLRFCVGMGKPFWSVKDKHGTEFGLAPIPLGGYVKMLDERESKVPDEDLKFAYNRKPVWQRIAILLAGPMANFLLALCVFALLVFVRGETGAKPVIGSIAAGSLAEQSGLGVGQEILSIDGVETGSRQAVLEQLLMRLGETGTMEFAVSDAAEGIVYEYSVNLDAWLRSEQDPDPLGGMGFMFYYPPILVDEVLADSAAELSGLKPDDEIVGVDQLSSVTMRQWVDYVKSKAGQPMNVIVRRSGRELAVPMTPKLVVDDEGKQVGRVGIQMRYEWPDGMIRKQSFGPGQSLARGFEKTVDTSIFVLVSIKKLILGQISTKNLSGPIGIAKVAGDRAKAGFVYFVEFLALLSISLGVLNLLPIPILDGGHILYCLIEGIKGSPVSEKIQMMGYSAGLAVLACVMVLALYNDILRF